MRNLFILIFCFYALESSSQEKLGKPFFTGTSSLSFAINEYYTLDPDDDEPLIIPTAIFLRFGFGYEFKKRVAISLNGGYDYHWRYETSAFPTYISLKFNVTENEGDTFFIETNYGKMWRPTNNYPDGNYYGLGIGTQIAGSERWNTIVKLAFHRKSILGFENNRLDSVSFGIGFSFF